MTEAEKRAKHRYAKKLTRVQLEFYPTEKDLIDKINSQPQKATYIKNLIREDIKKEGSN